MKFNEIKKIDGINTYKIDDYVSGNKEIIVFDVKKDYATNIFNEYIDFLLKGGKLLSFDKTRKITDSVYGDITLIEYDNKENRDKDSDLMNKKINIINPIKSEELNGNRQISEPIGKLDLDGKYYLFLYPYNGTTNEINPELGIYKGVIVNPELYFGKIENQIDGVEDRIINIL